MTDIYIRILLHIMRVFILSAAPQAEPQPEPEPSVSASTVSVSEGVPPGGELMAVGVAAVQDVNAQVLDAYIPWLYTVRLSCN